MGIEAVLFDLDGTLVDTAPDLVAVLNRLLLEEGRPPAPYALARNEVSNGAMGLLRLGFGHALPAARMESLRTRFLELYTAKVCTKSRLFIALDDITNLVSSSGWGIVTNKPHLMTLPLLTELGMAEPCRCIISGDRLPQQKPHPAPLLLAASELGVAAGRCIYVGDAPRDIEAGRAAGMPTIAAAYGYIRPGTDVLAWGATAVIRHPSELADTIDRLAYRAAHDAA